MSGQEVQVVGAPELPPAINGTEQRLDTILVELRAIRELLTPPPPESTQKAASEPVETAFQTVTRRRR